jgi:hypothetical protein
MVGVAGPATAPLAVFGGLAQQRQVEDLLEACRRLDTFGIDATEAWIDETMDKERQRELLIAALGVVVMKRDEIFPAC